VSHTYPLQFAFVERIESVGVYRRSLEPQVPDVDSAAAGRERSTHSLDYGQSFAQLKLLQVPELHDLGFTGLNVTIAVLDSGFKTSVPCFSHLKILEKHDFVKSAQLAICPIFDQD
jgi:hypothetical protein